AVPIASARIACPDQWSGLAAQPDHSAAELRRRSASPAVRFHRSSSAGAGPARQSPPPERRWQPMPRCPVCPPSELGRNGQVKGLFFVIVLFLQRLGKVKAQRTNRRRPEDR